MKDLELYEFREVVEIYSLLPESQWQAYESMEITDQREQLLLNKALKNLKAAYQKVHNHGQEGYEETA